MGHKWDRDAKRPPTLQEERATDPRPRPQRGRKDTRRWCRGKVGREHTTALRLSKYAAYRKNPCGLWWGSMYICAHQRYCTTCGKILKHLSWRECPDNDGRQASL